MKFFASEKIGSNRKMTPEGYMLIEGTPIARIGIQKYLPEELRNKIAPNADGYVDILRTPEEVFSPISIASYNGKPFVNEHPDNLIDAGSWRGLALGVIMNPRRGEGEYSDHLVADLMIYDEGAIMLVNSGKVELSCGYSAEYIETGVGTGEQTNIVGNHLALVGEGRCGPSCAIGDHAHVHSLSCNCNHKPEIHAMKTTMRQKLMNALGVSDKAALDKMLDEEGAGGVHIHLPGGVDEDPMEKFSARMDGFEAGMKGLTDWMNECRERDKKAADEKAAKDAEEEKARKDAAAAAETAKGEDARDEEELEKEAPEGTGDKARKATDSTYLADSFQQTVALGEILVPGFSPPVFDKAAAPKISLKSICAYRGRILDAANTTTDGKIIINDILGGKPLDVSKMSCDQTRSLFFAAAAAKKQLNNNGGRQHVGDVNGRPPESKIIRSVADLQKFAHNHYKRDQTKTTH